MKKQIFKINREKSAEKQNFCLSFVHLLITTLLLLFLYQFLTSPPFLKRSMSSRLKWTPQEEELLKNLGSRQLKNKWTHIAKAINDQMPPIQRTPKQCRQKYNNHLIFGEKCLDGNWSQIEDEALFSEYRQKGPKWKKISQSFSTKSQNTIKNRFYGNVRKIVRKLNKIGKMKISKSFKPIKEKSIIRIIEPDCGLPEIADKIIEQMQGLRQKLLDVIQSGIYEDESQQSQKIQQYIELIKQIHRFNCTCRFYRNFKAKPNRKNSRTNKNNQSKTFKNSTQGNSSNSSSHEENSDDKDSESSDEELNQMEDNFIVEVEITAKQTDNTVKKQEANKEIAENKNINKEMQVGKSFSLKTIEIKKQSNIIKNRLQKSGQNTMQNQKKQTSNKADSNSMNNRGDFLTKILSFMKEYCENKDRDCLKSFSF